MLSIIAIIGKNRELGKDNKLLWKIPPDLERFRMITKGHPVIMGRKTFESIGHPLPDRANIVISSHTPSGVIVVRTFGEAIEKAKQEEGSDEIFVIGGGSIYAQAIDLVDRLYLTVVEASADADTFFPDYSKFSVVVSREKKKSHGFLYEYLTLERS